MQKLYIVRGLPGSGKTTYAESLGISHFEADSFFYDADGNYHFVPSLVSTAHEVCQADTERALQGGKNVVVANTFTTEWEVLPYIDMANKYNVSVVLHTCDGDYGSVHGVPEYAVKRMRERFVSHDDMQATIARCQDGV